MKKLILLLLLTLTLHSTKAQEIFATVQVLAPRVPNMSPSTLLPLQNAISNFLNNHKWTSETYLSSERINCNLIITLTEWDGAAGYKASAQLQSWRPVFGTSYQTTLLNLSDQYFDFNYNEGQALDFSDQTYQSNLTSLLGFYAYTIIGTDKDSFSKLGGELYYIKAQRVIQLAQNNGNMGWRAADGLRNRYWLNENLLSKSFEDLRSFSYQYHRKGLDLLQENKIQAIKAMISYLPSLQQMDQQRLGAVFNHAFYAAKATEFVQLFTMAPTPDKIKAYNLLTSIDPANSSKYDQLKNLQ
ncbi:DUF4835 family protein [Pedobacter sp.]|uniref:type IX secretion system protein PorD n=1 Tax=Pedobacter sp. TaxID=1411316 RepID=UPI003D7FA043